MDKYYSPAADVVLEDLYPIPKQPLTWLSDSIDEVHLLLGRDKPVWAIVQAYNWGDEPLYSNKARSRYPTLDEEWVLAYLAIVHRVRGIFFFSRKAAPGKTPGIGGESKKLLPSLDVFILSSLPPRANFNRC
jgi:hypothetical protein